MWLLKSIHGRVYHDGETIFFLTPLCVLTACLSQRKTSRRFHVISLLHWTTSTVAPLPLPSCTHTSTWVGERRGARQELGGRGQWNIHLVKANSVSVFIPYLRVTCQLAAPINPRDEMIFLPDALSLSLGPSVDWSFISPKKKTTRTLRTCL